mmetsp:Transcript_35666/g.89480  ORF Transcript_35666/g.89480 Transcript_35666/m.89480 type:complete len:93 (+) Transcript_35666:106-384(+)
MRTALPLSHTRVSAAPDHAPVVHAGLVLTVAAPISFYSTHCFISKNTILIVASPEFLMQCLEKISPGAFIGAAMPVYGWRAMAVPLLLSPPG